MTESEEILKQAREKLAELLEKDDPILARQARTLHSADDLYGFIRLLRYAESYRYPCCHAAYEYALGAYVRLIDAILAEAGFDARSREGRLPIPP
jgi:hypothetical protein